MKYEKKEIYEVVSGSFSVLDIANPIITIINPEWSLSDAAYSFIETSDESGKKEWFGLVKDEKQIYGYLCRDSEIFCEASPNELQEHKALHYAEKIDTNNSVSSDMPILDIIPLFLTQFYYFILEKNTIKQVVNFYDLDKLPIKLCIYALLLQLEEDLIMIISEKDLIDQFINNLPKERHKKAFDLAIEKYKLPAAKIENYQILCSTTFIDKKTMLRKDSKFMQALGISKEKFDSQFKKIENIRNCIAHSNSILDTLKTPKEFNEFIENLNTLIKKVNALNNMI